MFRKLFVARSMEILQVPFVNKFLTMDEVTRHIELAADIPHDSQVLQLWDGRTFYNCKLDDCNQFISDEFFAINLLIVNTVLQFQSGNTPDLIKHLIAIFNVNNPRPIETSAQDKTRYHYNPKTDLIKKYADMKLRLYNRFTYWPYLLEEISDELNRDHKSNSINYNPQVMYYWENTAYITSKIMNDKIALILPMTKEQIFYGLKKMNLLVFVIIFICSNLIMMTRNLNLNQKYHHDHFLQVLMMVTQSLKI